MKVENGVEIKEKIKSFIQKRIGKDKQIEDADDIFRTGYVNSMFALELVSFIEQAFALRVENEDIDLKNFSSLNNMEAFVLRKRG